MATSPYSPIAPSPRSPKALQPHSPPSKKSDWGFSLVSLAEVHFGAEPAVGEPVWFECGACAGWLELARRAHEEVLQGGWGWGV
eukprot:4401386-Pyramimonas_sp.AAC.1